MMTRPIWEQETIPLPRLSGWLLEHFLSIHQLNLREVARAAQLPLLVVWRACRGLPIAPWQAARLTEGLYALTGVCYRPRLLTQEDPNGQGGCMHERRLLPTRSAKSPAPSPPRQRQPRPLYTCTDRRVRRGART
jgi:hypothetical protein